MRARLRARLAFACSALSLVVAAGAHAGAPHQLPGDLAIVDLEGRTWTRETLAGRAVLVDFWATWCAPCLRERSRLSDLRSRHPERELVILSVNVDHADRRSLVAWLNRRRLDWPQAHVPLGLASPLAAAFGVRSLPWTVVYGPDGGLVGTDMGAVETALGPRRCQAMAAPARPAIGPFAAPVPPSQENQR
jgi:thiol-disulfide isomerase/thioredoxin